MTGPGPAPEATAASHPTAIALAGDAATWLAAAASAFLVLALIVAVPAVRPAGRFLWPMSVVAMGIVAVALLVHWPRLPVLRVRPGWAAPVRIGCRAAALLLAALPLLRAWTSGATAYSTIGGLIPYSDAAGYLRGAWHLLTHGQLSQFGSRRPLTAVFLAGGIGALGDLRAVLLLQAAIVGGAAFAAARAVASRLGAAPAFLTFAGILVFASRFSTSTLSEPLGIAFGSLGLAALVESTRRPRSSVLAGGMFATALGLIARAGPFGVLPALLVWAGTVARSRRWLWVGAALMGMALAFGANWAAERAYASRAAAGNANFYYTLYGLSAGGKGYGQTFQDLPAVSSMAEAEQARVVRAKALELIRARPGLLLRGLLRGEWDFLTVWKLAAPTAYLRLPVRLGAVAATLLLAALIVHRLVRRLRWDPLLGLLGAVALGTVLSAAVIATDGGYRVFAAVVPYGVLAVALALERGTTAAVAPEADAAGRAGGLGASLMALALAVAAVGLPGVFHWREAASSGHPLLPCVAPAVTAAVDPRGPMVAIELVPAGRGATFAPRVRLDDFAADPSFHGHPLAAGLAAVGAPGALVLAENVVSGSMDTLPLFFAPARLLTEPGPALICLSAGRGGALPTVTGYTPMPR